MWPVFIKNVSPVFKVLLIYWVTRKFLCKTEFTSRRNVNVDFSVDLDVCFGITVRCYKIGKRPRSGFDRGVNTFPKEGSSRSSPSSRGAGNRPAGPLRAAWDSSQEHQGNTPLPTHLLHLVWRCSSLCWVEIEWLCDGTKLEEEAFPMDPNLPGSFLFNNGLNQYPSDMKAPPVCQYSVQNSFYKLGPGLSSQLASGTPHGISDILSRSVIGPPSSTLLSGYSAVGSFGTVPAPGICYARDYGASLGSFTKPSPDCVAKGRSGGGWGDPGYEWRGARQQCGTSEFAYSTTPLGGHILYRHYRALKETNPCSHLRFYTNIFNEEPISTARLMYCAVSSAHKMSQLICCPVW